MRSSHYVMFQLQSLASDSVDVNTYVKQSVVESVARANSSYTWWSVYGDAFLSALPRKYRTKHTYSTLLNNQQRLFQLTINY